MPPPILSNEIAYSQAALRAAQWWRLLGVATIPIRYRDKRPDGRLVSTWEEYKHRLPTNMELLRWFGGGFHNVGLVTGWRNLVVVDFDNPEVYLRWSLWAARRNIRRLVSSTLKVVTWRGVHVYFFTAQPGINQKLPGIDIKACNGYVLIPPSIHPSGSAYRVYEGRFPAEIDALSDVLPADLLVSNTEYSEVVRRDVLPVIFSSGDAWSSSTRVLDPYADLIEQIKARYCLESFLMLDVRTTVRWAMTRCPFHDDANPSFWVDTFRQLCGCFAGCTPKPYDVIDLYARLHNLTARDAILCMMRGVVR